MDLLPLSTLLRKVRDLMSQSTCYGVALIAQQLLMHEYMASFFLVLDSGNSDHAANAFLSALADFLPILPTLCCLDEKYLL